MCCIFFFFWAFPGTGTSSSVAVASPSSSTALFFPSAFDCTVAAVGSIGEPLEMLVSAPVVASGEEKVRNHDGHDQQENDDTWVNGMSCVGLYRL